MNAPTYQHPLEWPISWSRARYQYQSRFGSGRGVNTAFGRDELVDELRRLGASEVCISTNVRLTRSGVLDGGAAEPGDHGAAVYFRLKGEPRVLACDKWNRVGDNLLAMAKHVEAIRGQVRWGVGSLEQAFGGYRALPAMEAPRHWSVILGVKENAPTAEVEARRIALLEKCHPDRGGKLNDAVEVNIAYTEFRRERGLTS